MDSFNTWSESLPTQGYMPCDILVTVLSLYLPEQLHVAPSTRTFIPSKHTVSGHCRPAGETPFKWCFAVGSMVFRFQMFTWFYEETFIVCVNPMKTGSPLNGYFANSKDPD